jgi:UrcA family protein
MNTSRNWLASLAAAISKTVKMYDLELAKSEDVQTLYSRVRDAATEVCRAEVRRYHSQTRRNPPLGWTERCVDDAVDAAVREVLVANLGRDVVELVGGALAGR